MGAVELIIAGGSILLIDPHLIDQHLRRQSLVAYTMLAAPGAADGDIEKQVFRRVERPVPDIGSGLVDAPGVVAPSGRVRSAVLVEFVGPDKMIAVGRGCAPAPAAMAAAAAAAVMAGKEKRWLALVIADSLSRLDLFPAE